MIAWQLSNAAFLAITTLAVFLTVGIAARVTLGNIISWKLFSFWMLFGIGIVLIQIQGAALPRYTINTELPAVPDKQIEFTPTELVPKREWSEWQKTSDEFDDKQDQRIKDNSE